MKSNYQLFKEKTWAYLKSKGYSRKDSLNFVLHSDRITTVIEIQKGKHGNYYAMYNISYCHKDTPDPCVRNSDFFRMRQDYFNRSGFHNFGSDGSSPFPMSLDFDNEEEVNKAIKVLQEIEPIFRGQNKEQLIHLYRNEKKMIERVEKLFT